ncbi:MAG: ribosome small subunit-dependent GTPase A [Anaerovibrio sp.]|uniref:ribosome small subunit-dependent GTPase A n=1 Tax=Anaerovibrio sp. TaxID=1872532 RepID=UPI0025F8F248|nr:ribosome small subunit-dependent GTPase A [Anaerovibrio sp.]MCR5177307.1 ribosome small subunit-dependent GTPase A [Anaerovibrio sp.]
MPIGQVVKTYNGFYYLKAQQDSAFSDSQLLSCRLRGRIKRVRGAVVTGDMVGYELLGDGTGVIEKCLPRKSMLYRPAVANIDQVIITFAIREPDINSLLLNRFLVMAEWSDIPEIIICLNKIDLMSDIPESFIRIYSDAGYRVICTSAHTGEGIEEIRGLLRDRVTVFAGPSGVGKSSLLNAIDKDLMLATGQISEKIKRGKHTTRVARLLPVQGGGIVVDTPGFGAAELEHIDKSVLAGCFPEFRPLIEKCYYNTCTHSHEPDCGVKAALNAGLVSQERYDAYLNILQTILERKKAY